MVKMTPSERAIPARYLYKIIKPNSPESVTQAIEAGMIPLKDLIDGRWYIGYCRNALMVKWDAKAQEFVYKRYKFGSEFEDTVPHPETQNDNSDIFVPIEEL